MTARLSVSDVASRPEAPRIGAKARRRRRIQHAALQLFAGQGFENTTLLDVAVAADVAHRTVSIHFPSKIDLALSGSTEAAASLVDVTRKHPDTNLFEIIRRWITVESNAGDRELARLTTAMFVANPQPRASSTPVIAEAMKLGSAALLAQLDLPRGHWMGPIITASIAAAVTEYRETVAGAEPADATLGEFIDYLRTIVEAASKVGRSATRPDNRRSVDRRDARRGRSPPGAPA